MILNNHEKRLRTLDSNKVSFPSINSNMITPERSRQASPDDMEKISMNIRINNNESEAINLKHDIDYTSKKLERIE